MGDFIASHDVYLGIDDDNNPDRMFIALNGNAVVYHYDPAATQIRGWNEWVIVGEVCDAKVYDRKSMMELAGL